MPADQLEELVEDLADLRHDLGKYVCFEARFVADPGDRAALRAALQADLRRTRRRGAEVEGVGGVWARLRPTALEGDPTVQRLDAAVAQLASADLDAPDARLADLAAQARAVSQACRDLHGRARARWEALDG